MQLFLKVCLRRPCPGKATYHEMDHDHVNHRLTGLWQKLVVLTQAAVAIEPPQGALHNPPFRQEEEAFGPLRPLDHLDADFPPGPQLPQPGDEVPSIGLIGPDQAQAGELMSQDVQEQHGPVAVLHLGGGDDHRED
jgi:hypothetical protein